MKKIYYFILASAVSVALNSCTNDDIVGGENNGTEKGLSEAIAFGSGFKALTRAEKIGADAAAALHNRFVVDGYKTADGTTYNKVFDNYGVEWTENTAGKTASNTSDWEYVGATKSPVTSITTEQTIKFWDYSTSSYDFIAYSTGAATETATTPTTGQVQVVAIDYANKGTLAYSLKGAKADLVGCYIADLVTVNKANYGKEVELTFRSLASKVRLAIYETVPGYSVQNVKFYTQNVDPTKLGTDPRTNAATTNTAALIGTFANDGQYNVHFTSSVAHVSVTGVTNDAYATFGNFPTTTIGTSSATPTYAPGNPSSTDNFTQVLPNETGNALELAVDYQLVADDGSGEVINVYGATAYIPTAYTQWKPNFAYTYIFKISDNTNGWTSQVQNDPKGLFPITFDAIVADTEETGKQATITNVASPSITTYQNGHNPSSDEYSAAKGKIYVQVMGGANDLKSDLGTNGHLYTLSAAKTEAEVLDALHIKTNETTTSPVTITGRNGLTLTEATTIATITTIPCESGNVTVATGTAAEFTPQAPTSPATVNYYAYVYDTQTWDGVAISLTTEPANWTTGGYYSNKECTTAAPATFAAGTYYQKVSYIYTAETMTSTTAPTDWTTVGLWYKDPNGETAAGDWDASNNGKVFYKKYTVDHKIYGVKVIKVVN